MVPAYAPNYLDTVKAELDVCIDNCVKTTQENTIERWMYHNICGEDAILKKYLYDDFFIELFRREGRQFELGKSPLDDAAINYDYGRVEQLLEIGIFDKNFAAFAFVHATSAVSPVRAKMHTRFNQKKTIALLMKFISEPD